MWKSDLKKLEILHDSHLICIWDSDLDQKGAQEYLSVLPEYIVLAQGPMISKEFLCFVLLSDKIHVLPDNNVDTDRLQFW